MSTDSNVDRISKYLTRLRFADLPSDVVHDCKRRIIDTIGCGIGAFTAEPCRIARRIALRARIDDGAHVLGTNARVLPELAAFANGVMMRYLDGNDSYPGGGGHASDAISAILAAADHKSVSGQDVIKAVVASYDVFYNLYTAAKMRDKGWDHVFYIAVAAAAGASCILQLNKTQTEHALSLAITPNLALEVTRRGHLSMWKGCAGGNAARNGLFAAILASEGITGPAQPVEGTHGLWHFAGKFHMADFPDKEHPFRIKQANLKYFLSEYHSLGPIEAAMALYKQLGGEEVRHITVYTYGFARQEIGNEPEKWHPTTRESADHSLPFIIAAVLLDGSFSDAIFSPERIADPAVHALADKISIEEDTELTNQFPNKVPCRIEAITASGQKKTAAVEYPRGHYRNPMTDTEVDKKFLELAARNLRDENASELLRLLWNFENERSTQKLFRTAIIDKAT